MSQRPGDAPTESRRVSVALAGRKFFLLFLFLLASLVLFPYAENSVLGYYGFRVLGSTAIVLCVYVVSFRRSLVVAALLLAVPTFLHRVLNLGAPSSWFSILNIVLSFLFDVFIVVVTFRRVFAPKQPNSETIFGALCIYLLAGFAFASIMGWWHCCSRAPSISTRWQMFTPFPTGSISFTTALGR
jgi:hypothetical protein